MNKAISVSLGGESGGTAVVLSFTNLTQEEYKQLKKDLSKYFGIEY